MAIGRRGRGPAASVVPYQGAGLGLPVVTQLPTRQWRRPARRVRQVVPIDWRPQGPQLTFGADEPAAPGSGASTCEGC